MTSLMTSPGHKIGQIWILSYSVDQKLKMSEMLMVLYRNVATETTHVQNAMQGKHRPASLSYALVTKFNALDLNITTAYVIA